MDEKSVVSEFLRKCVEYSDGSIGRKQERGELEEIPKWEAYREFTQHAIDEIASGKLDAWFSETQSGDLTNPQVLNIDDLDHFSRAQWLSGLVSPRPIIIASTENSDGTWNLAPLTSLMVVSNTPPLIILSLSQDREGRPRDTLLNLRANGSALLHMIPATARGVEMIDECGTPLPYGEEEASLIGEELAQGMLTSAVAAVRVEMVEERELPDAVARLVTLRVREIFTPNGEMPIDGLDALCQHGMDRITPNPTGWATKVSKHHG